jgi:signal transduction histidine kinase
MVGLLVALAVYSGRRSVPGALPFTISCLFAAVWPAGSVLEYLAVDLAAKIAWFKFEAVWQLPIVTTITCFFLEYAWPGRWLTRRNLILLSIPCVLALFSVSTNDLHHLTWLGFAYDGKVIPLDGPFTWIIIIYALVGLGIVNLIVFAWLFQRSPQHRWPVVIMLTGQIVGRAVYALDSAGMIQSALPIKILGMSFEFLMYAIALFGFRLFDPILLARQTAIAQMREGMLVLDHQGQLIDLNQAAERILNLPARQARGRPLTSLLPSASLPPGYTGETAITEFCLGNGPETRYYQWESTSLKDWRGLLSGYLFLLHDVTGQKLAQVQAMERLWVQATLQEREQLANELHDGLAQSLSFLNLQAQTVQVHLQGGREEVAQAALARLTEAAGQIQDDTRELIGNLLVVIRPVENFCHTLRQVLANFEQLTGMPVRLDIEGDTTAEACYDPARLPPRMAIQLVRITQEALANIRKHAREARLACVELKISDQCVSLIIADDGAGFDPKTLSPEGKHFGLQVMRQRAASVGGRVEIWSVPGQGTRITVRVPLVQPVEERGEYENPAGR